MLDRFEALNITKSIIKVPERINKKLFNMYTLREAFINSIAHTKWTEFNSPQIQVFSDRIEIISTGRMINELSKEDFYKDVSKLRNPELMRILRELELVEHTGFGVPTIVENYGREAFEFLDGFVKVTIPFDKEVMEYMPNVDQDVGQDLQSIILASIAANNNAAKRNGCYSRC